MPKFTKASKNIEWAGYTWNPITGREPRFYPERLLINQRPKKKGAILKDTIVYTCTMDNFCGAGVEKSWRPEVFKFIRDNHDWKFVFLTKTPERAAKVKWPLNTKNVWVGAIVDKQNRVERAEEAFSKVKATVKFVSCEPLQEDLTFSNMEVFDWVIIGARDRGKDVKVEQPKKKWLTHLYEQARDAKCAVYMKPNLTVYPKGITERLKQYPKKGQPLNLFGQQTGS